MKTLPVDIDPGLLDVVPWSHGYAHSWALAALLSDPRTSGAVLAVTDDLGLPGPLAVVGEVQREGSVPGARADLAFRVRDSAGHEHEVALETKVNDPFRETQIQAYRDSDAIPLLFLPGLTGLWLAAGERTAAGEHWLFPAQLLNALDGLGVTFGALLTGYLDGLRAETQRMTQATESVQAGIEHEPVRAPGRPTGPALMDVVWLAEIYRLLPEVCEGSGISPDATLRTEPNDRGLFFGGGCRILPTGGSVWVDVLADLHTHRRAIAIKVGDGSVPESWDLLAQTAPSSDVWQRAQRRVQGSTATVWKLDLDGVSAREAAQHALSTAGYIAEMAESR